MTEKSIEHKCGYHLADWLRETAYPVMIRELPAAHMERQIVNLGWKSPTPDQRFALVMDGLSTTLNFIDRATNPQLPHKPLRKVILEMWDEPISIKGDQFIYSCLKPGFSLSFENQLALFQRIQTLVIDIEEVMYNPSTLSSKEILQDTWDELRRHWNSNPIRSNGYPLA